jgi:aspartyl/asparaginyl beta-hydroxylase (cupin superfamily)
MTAQTPGDLPAVSHAALSALASGELAVARTRLEAWVALDASAVRAWLHLAAVRRDLGDPIGALEAARSALGLEPRNFSALLLQATLLDRVGQSQAAARAYAVALVQAPSDAYLDDPTRRVVAHARKVSAAYTSRLREHLHAAVGGAADGLDPRERRRLDGFIETTLRTRRRFQQEPLEYWVPGLPAIEFHERAAFPWIDEFEAAAPAMREELAQILADDAGDLVPYVRYPTHAPLDQWRELNQNPRWSAFHFYEQGHRVEARCRRAPRTIAAIERLPQPQVARRSPAAMFSVLRPRTRIPPHTGAANFRLVVHLPLVVPGGCGFRVGGETREWRAGEAWVFDDTIEHEAWNESDETRVILICDVWNPLVPPEQRALIARVIAATDAFNGVTPSDTI